MTGVSKSIFLKWYSVFNGYYQDFCYTWDLKYDSMYTIWCGVDVSLLGDPEYHARRCFFNHFDEELDAISSITGMKLVDNDIYTGPCSKKHVFSELFLRNKVSG